MTLNLPFAAGIDGTGYRKLLDDALSAVSKYRPDFVAVSLGFDTYRGEIGSNVRAWLSGAIGDRQTEGG